MSNTDCIFCKIVEGNLPSTKIYEDENTLAFLDIKPVNPGHTLVIPKAHYENVFESPEEIWGCVMQTAKKVAHGVKDGLQIGDLNIAMNNGKHSGQVVFHAHVHIMPRHKNDGHKLWIGRNYDEGEAQKIAEQIKKAL